MMESVRLKQVAQDYRNHLQAYLNFVVKAEKKAGKNKTKPVYNRFEKFFNYERRIEEVKNKGKDTGRFAGLKRFLKKGVE